MKGLLLQSYDEISIGDELPTLSFHIQQEHINQYAEVSKDFNPLHIDEDFAKNTPFKSTIAHGLMSTAFVSQLMMKWHWKGWVSGGVMDIVFTSPLYPGDTVYVKGKVINKHDISFMVTIELDVTNQSGKNILVGTTQISFKNEK